MKEETNKKGRANYVTIFHVNAPSAKRKPVQTFMAPQSYH